MDEAVTLSLTGNKTSLSANYFPPINVHEDSEIALLCLQTYNTFPNINETNNRMAILIQDNEMLGKDENFNIEVPVGFYEINDLVKYIMSRIDEHNKTADKKIDFKMSVMENEYLMKIKCNHPLKFNVPNSIASIFGFDKTPYASNQEITSEKLIDINPINSIKVICNIANGSFSNSQPSHSIHEFFPAGTTGTKIVERPSNLIYYKLNTPVIDRVHIELVDQDQNPIHNFREKITVVLHIRRCRYGTDI